MRRLNSLIVYSAALSLMLPLDASSRSYRAGKRGLYGAIAYHASTQSIGYSFDFKTAREAHVAALNQCAQPECEVVLSLHNSCGALATKTAKRASSEGATKQEAETKALRRCGSGCSVIAWTCTK